MKKPANSHEKSDTLEYLTREKHDLVEELKLLKPEQFNTPKDY